MIPHARVPDEVLDDGHQAERRQEQGEQGRNGQGQRELRAVDPREKLRQELERKQQPEVGEGVHAAGEQGRRERRSDQRRPAQVAGRAPKAEQHERRQVERHEAAVPGADVPGEEPGARPGERREARRRGPEPLLGARVDVRAGEPQRRVQHQEQLQRERRAEDEGEQEQRVEELRLRVAPLRDAAALVRVPQRQLAVAPQRDPPELPGVMEELIVAEAGGGRALEQLGEQQRGDRERRRHERGAAEASSSRVRARLGVRHVWETLHRLTARAASDRAASGSTEPENTRAGWRPFACRCPRTC